MSEQQINTTSVVSASTDVFSTAIGEDLVIFDQKGGSYYGAGEVGARIWALLTEDQAVAAICDKLMAEFDVERGVCEKQVLDFLSELQERALIKIS